MDVLAQSGSPVAFSVAVETFANPVKTTTPGNYVFNDKFSMKTLNINKL